MVYGFIQNFWVHGSARGQLRARLFHTVNKSAPVHACRWCIQRFLTLSLSLSPAAAALAACEGGEIEA